MIRKLKFIIKRKQDEREIMTWSGSKNLDLLLKNLTLRYHTWLSLSDEAGKAIIPRSRSYQIVVFHTIVRFR